MSKLDGYKKGDRVRVTFEGVVDEIERRSGVRVKAEKDFLWIGSGHNDTNDHFHIERIAQPVKVGDMVTWGSGIDAYEVVAIRNGYASMWHEGNSVFRSYKVADLRHA